MMSPEAPRPALQQRVTAAILDGAAQVFVLAGEQASMNQVASVAGVARATVYRYFPNREALLAELLRAAIEDVDARLASARIDEVAPEEAIARVVRALVEIGDRFVLLARERPRSDQEQYERKLVVPVRRLFERAQASGEIRADMPGHRLVESLVGLIVGMLTSAAPLGRDDLSATITSLFLDGARARGPRLP
ncbi:MAG: TetR/AcrR family transcriptional regulator [Solirubrobacterales bacterium]|nr:TetR/AcrR family transcriptional regulator [Solirubrobacterales bacterium]